MVFGPSDMARMRLHRGWTYRKVPKGIEMTRLATGERVLISGSGTTLENVCDVLRTGVAVASGAGEVARATGIATDTAAALLSRMEHAGMVLTVADDDDQYSRQRDFFSIFERPSESGAALHQRLAGSTVAIVGLGGYGTWLLLLAARIGIGRIVAIDSDVVELSNLGRQVLYTREDIGQLKVDVAAKRIAEIDPSICYVPVRKWISSPDDLVSEIRGVDLVFNPFGYHINPSLAAVVDACLVADVPSLLLGGSWVGPLTIPGQTACYSCLTGTPLIADIFEAAQADYMPRPGEGVPRRSSSQFAPRVAADASLAVWEASRFLAGLDSPPSLRGVTVVDFSSYLHGGFQAVERDLNCCRCGGLRPH